MFVEQRIRSQQHFDELKEYVHELNGKLASSKKFPKKESVHRKVSNELRKRNLLSCYDIDISTIKQKLNVKLELNCQVWQKRRRYNGFVLLVGHSDLVQPGVELAKLYRAKDAIEKDFQTIKSVLKLRPIYHYKDSKVRAHITLCMLALLLERTLERKLRLTTERLTAPSCFEQLSTCHLNQHESYNDLGSMYTVTQPTLKQKGLLKVLNLEHLVDEESLMEIITPR